jgi:protein-disulfide isomerase-like protein with CxxC motif
MEKDYYNALLDIQKKFPDEVNSFQIIIQKDNNKMIEDYEISTYPTLLILDDNKIKIRIEGNQTQNFIYEKLEKVYEQ